MKKLISLVLAASIGSAMTIGAFMIFQPQSKVYRIEHQNVAPSISTRYDGNKDTPLDFSYTAEKVTPAVVHIKSTVTGNRNGRGRSEQIPDAFRDFFGEGNPFGDSGPSVGTGSGVIISENGIIVTNNHVIENADDIEVTLYDNRVFKANVIGTDPTTDLAVLRINQTNLPFLSFANSDQVKVGEWVLAVGNPFNLNSTVTAGIVSAKGRSINILRKRTAIESFIQTDAAVNPGNSGGALVNLDGGLVGINTAIASRTGSYAGYSFAVPSRIVSKVVEDLIEYGTVQRGFLGVVISSVDANRAKQLGLEDLNAGVRVDSLSAGGAAEAAGILPGDVIVEVDGIPVAGNPDLIGRIGTKRPGEKATLLVNRDGNKKEFEVTLRNSSGTTLFAERPAKSETLSTLGADFENLTREDKSDLEIDGGVRVSRMYPGKLRKNTEMREGFIITHVDNKRVKDIEDLTQILDRKKEGGVLIEGFYPTDPGESYYYALGMDND